jgi:GTPase Era involved in 16S rRNA processing
MNDFTAFIEKKQQLLKTVNLLINVVKTEFNNQDINLLHHFQNELSNELTFKMLCIGDFSSGKSTFINRFLLQEDILPAFPRPTTTRLTKVRYGESLKAQLVFQNDSVEEVSINVSERLLEAVSVGGKDIDQVRHVIVDSPSSILQDGIELVDAPGLNDPDGERMKLTFDYLHQADAILFFLNAQQPWTNYQKLFFEKDLLTKKDIDKLFIVVNYWDQIDFSDRQDVLDYINDQLQVSLANQHNNGINNHPIELHVLPVSSKTGENGDVVKQHIWDYLANRKSYDVLSGKVKSLNGYVDAYIKNIEDKTNLLKLDNISREKKRLSLEREIADYKKSRDVFILNLAKSLKPEFDEFKRTMESLFDQLLSSICSLIQKISQANLNATDINTKLSMQLSRLQDELTAKMEIQEIIFIERIKNLIEEQKGIIDVPINSEVSIQDYYLKWEQLSGTGDLKAASITTSALGVASFLFGTSAFVYAPTQGVIATFGAFISGTSASTSMLFGLPGIAIGVVAIASSFYFKRRSDEKTAVQLIELSEQIEHTINQEKLKVVGQLIKRQKESIDTICNNVDDEITQSYSQKLEELAGINSNGDQGAHFESILKTLHAMKLQVNL